MTPPQGQTGSLLGPGGAARRVFVLVAALLMMWGLHALRMDADSGAVDAMTLAAAGFVLLTAFTVGELGGAIGLPKVTGYIVAGAMLGPQVSDILSGRVVDELGTFNTLALGLIATTAGLELHLPAIRRVARTMSATVVLKILLLPVLVGLPFVLSQLVWPSFELPGWPGLLAMALIISVLGLGTSPAIALAVANDTGAKGRLTDLLLGIAVVKDVVVVTCLAVSVAIAHALLSGGGLDTHVLLHLGGELAASVGVGAIVGIVLILYLRFVQAELLFATLVMVLVVAELSHVLHLELLLVFIVAGFVVRNFSRLEHALLEPLERISLPVFVVFFTTAGAGIDLKGTLAILPLAVGLVICRAGAYWLAARFGARMGGEDAPVARNAWLTYLPQAGVTLGLVLLAADALPELSGPITRLGMALVALNLLVGPVTLALGLKGAGETAAGRALRPAGDPGSLAGDVGAEPHGSDTATEPGAELATPVTGEQDPSASVEALASPELAELVRRLERDLEATISEAVAASMAPRAARRAAWAAPLLEPAEHRHTTLRRIRLGLETMPRDPEGGWERELAALYDRLDERIRTLPVWLEVPLDPELLEPAVGDGPALRLRRGVARLTARWERRRGRAVLRRMPVRQALRVSLEPRLAEAVAAVGASWYRSSAELTAGLRLLAMSDHAGSLPAMDERGIPWHERAQADLLFAMRAGLREAVPRLVLLGSPSLPSASIRYAEVEPRVANALERLVVDGPIWRERVGASLDTTRAVVHVELYVLAMGRSLETRVRLPLTAVREALLPELQQRAERFEALAAEAGDLGLDDAQLQRMAAGAEALAGRGRSSVLRRARGRFRRAVQPGPLLGDMAELSRNAPELLRVVARRTPVEQAVRPQDALIWEVAFGRAIDGLLHDGLLPSVGALLGPPSELVAAADSRVRDAVSVATYGVELAARGGFEGEQAQREVLVDSLRRAARRVEQLHTELSDALDHAETSLDKLLQDSSQGLRDLLDEQAQRPTARVRSTLVAVRQALLDAVGQVGAQLRSWYARLGLAARQLAQQQAVRDLRIRSGHERLDATAIAAYLDEAWPTADARKIPAVYARLLGPSPVGERRLFVARAGTLELLLDGVSAKPLRPAPSTLLVGRQGAGRSSLLSMVQLQLSGPRVLWLDATFANRAEGPVAALAAELGTAPSPDAVVDALLRSPAVVLLDDLECWLQPGPQGVAALEALLRVVDASVPGVRWVVSVDEGAFTLLEELLPLRQAFRRVVQLGPVSWQELQETVDQRERLGGFDTQFVPRGVRGGLQRLLRRGREKELYYRSLARMSEGNLGTAFAVHLQGLHALDEARLRADTPARPALPFLPWMSEELLALLGRLASFGPMEPPELEVALALDTPAIASRLHFLLHAGLVVQDQAGTRRISVNPRLAPALLRELRELRILPGGET